MGITETKEKTESKAKSVGAKIYKAVPAIMAELDAIGKNQVNQAQRFKFRGIDDVYNALCKLMAKHGVFSVPEILSERSEERQSKGGGQLIYRILLIKYTFYADDGSSVECIVIGEGMDSGDKAANKGMSVAHKYALIQVFCIPTADSADPDKDFHEVEPRPVVMAPRSFETPHPRSPTTAGIYVGTPEQQNIIAGILRKEKVPETYWDEISTRLMNRPSTALKGVIDEVRAGL